MFTLKNNRKPRLNLLFLELDVFVIMRVLNIEIFFVSDAVYMFSPWLCSHFT